MSASVDFENTVDQRRHALLEELNTNAGEIWKSQTDHSEKSAKQRAESLRQLLQFSIARLVGIGMDPAEAEQSATEVLKSVARNFQARR